MSKRFRSYPNGSFALNLSRFENVWIPFASSTNLDDALLVASGRAMELESDAFEVSLEFPNIKNDVAILCEVSRLRDRRHQASARAFRQSLRELRD